MRLPAAIVAAVLIWSAARYLPPYYLEVRKMDLEEEKLVVAQSHANAMLKQMRLQQTKADAPKFPPSHESHLF
jgi:hypothetical protein